MPSEGWTVCICLKTVQAPPDASMLPSTTKRQLIHSPLFCLCRGEGIGAVEMEVPSDGAEGGSSRGRSGDVEPCSLGGVCVAGRGRGAL